MPVSIIVATVESVDEENLTISAVSDTDLRFDEVSLDVFHSGGNSTLHIPEVGSLVVLGFVENQPEMPFIIRTTKLSKIVVANTAGSETSHIIITDDTLELKRGESDLILTDNQITLNAGQTVFNGGELDGMVRINELTEKLNGLVGEINTMVTQFNSHTHLSAAPGTPTGAPPASTPPVQMSNATEFDKNDYENTEILQ